MARLRGRRGRREEGGGGRDRCGDGLLRGGCGGAAVGGLAGGDHCGRGDDTPGGRKADGDAQRARFFPSFFSGCGDTLIVCRNRRRRAEARPGPAHLPPDLEAIKVSVLVSYPQRADNAPACASDADLPLASTRTGLSSCLLRLTVGFVCLFYAVVCFVTKEQAAAGAAC